MSEPPLVCGYLTLIGHEINGHEFQVSVEGDSGGVGILQGEVVRYPWIRPTCSCGWRSSDRGRYTIEENAHWRWLTEHVQEIDKLG